MSMRAILIDPEKRSFTEVQIGRGIEDIYSLLRCQSFCIGAKLSGSLRNGFEAIIVSDDMLEDHDDPKFWFQVDADHNPPSSYPIAGFGLASGTDPEGEVCDLKISIDDLKKRITFSHRKYRGVSVEHGDGSKGFHLKIEPVAPIIDGTDEGE